MTDPASAADTAAMPAATRPRVPLRVQQAIVVVVLLAATVGLVTGLFVALDSRAGAQLRPALRGLLEEEGGLLLMFGAFLAVALGLLVGAFFQRYVNPVHRMAQETRLLLDANAAHRLEPDAYGDAAELARVVNVLAERHERLQSYVDVRVREARGQLEQERHRLAALMSELTESVLVCNREGLILLYNAAARALFARDPDSHAAGLIGLGRSLFGLIDRELVAHALELVREGLAKGEARPVSEFVTAVPGGGLIRARMAPVLDVGGDPEDPEITGFVLTLHDITDMVQAASGPNEALASLERDTRAALGSIRAAIEALLEYEAMPPDQRIRFLAIIHDEAVRLTDRLNASPAGAPAQAAWPLQQLQGVDLLQALRRAIDPAEQGRVTIAGDAPRCWVGADSFALSAMIRTLARRLEEEAGVCSFALALASAGAFARLELRWQGRTLEAGRFAQWEAEPITGAGEHGPLTPREVARRHGGEHWISADRAGGAAYTVLLPLAAREPPSSPAPSQSARPEFYDFDLFAHIAAAGELDRVPLGKLAYTVFDTETTGLDPSGGDEIISISAVRIVNGRLLSQETFDQLVDPRRTVPQDSIAVHGITPRMLQGQPTLDRVLPRFARFAEGTVLVGHNVAFDLRFLELKEHSTGVRLTQPVLDTMLLTDIVQPDVADNTLDGNARRFGIPVIGRHTSLGDAILTGEVLIRLIPLLAARGVHTLGEALVASKQNYLARVKY